MGNGGLFCDENGQLVTGFTNRLENAFSAIVELWALIDDLLLALNLVISHLEVVIDAKMVYDIV